MTDDRWAEPFRPDEDFNEQHPTTRTEAIRIAHERALLTSAA